MRIDPRRDIGSIGALRSVAVASARLARWKPKLASGVTQMRLRGMRPSSTVQADWQGPTIRTLTPLLASSVHRALH